MIPHRFGSSEPFTVGIEEELFCLDAETLAPAPFPREALDGARLKEELFTSVVELNTGIHATAAEAVEELQGLRERAKATAGKAGLVLAGAGTWPTAVPEEQEIGPNEGLRKFVDYAGSSARRQYCSGLHVHVGMTSPEACIAALEAVLPWLPLVLAVSANSPYLAGRESGLRSTRAEILTLLPRAGAPPVFASYADWETFAETLVELGLAGHVRRIWWDVRPHPTLGTLEVRMPDQPTRLEATLALATAIRAMVAALKPDGPAHRGYYVQNRWAASRFGHDADLVHPDGSRLLSVRGLLDQLANLAGEEGVAQLRELDQAGEQLELGRAEGLEALCRRLVALT
ncbi:MAG TPA: YbdK family carboxylate-amine ligase [Gaiellaceae bacterium]|nr:YbdK family carboxylate-amine ligase [Gaiellaceae bacterium]